MEIPVPKKKTDDLKKAKKVRSFAKWVRSMASISLKFNLSFSILKVWINILNIFLETELNYIMIFCFLHRFNFTVNLQFFVDVFNMFSYRTWR